MAVRLYASGHLICQTVPQWEVMNPYFALKQLEAGRPACVALSDLYVVRTMVHAAIRLANQRRRLQSELLRLTV